MIADLVKLSFRNLRRRGKRSWLTVIGIVIGVTAIVSLFTLSQGLESSVTQEFNSLGANTIIVLPGEGLQSQFGGSELRELTEDDLEAVRAAQGVSVAGPVVSGSINVEYRDDTASLTVIGIPTGESQEFVQESQNVEPASGRGLRSTNSFEALAGATLLDTGQVFQEPVQQNRAVTLEDTDFRVIGRMEQQGSPRIDEGLAVPLEGLREVIDDDDRIDNIVAEAAEGSDPEEVAENIENEVRNERNLREGEEDFTVSTSQDLLNSLLSILSIVQYVVIGIISIALFVGGLGIMNTMYMSVSERTKEIGIMKALGATKRQILAIFLIESGMIGIVGGVIGVVLGIGIGQLGLFLVRQTVGIPVQASYSVPTIAGALGVSFLLGVFSGFFPARNASRLEPVEAIRQQ